MDWRALHTRRSGHPVRTLLGVVALLLAGFALTGCNGSPKAEPKVAKPTPFASYDGTTAAVQRISFCTRMPAKAVTGAVGKLSGTRHYANGEQSPDTKDVAHEYGCIFDGEAGVTARAWVFAPPVTPSDATRLVTSARGVKGCRALDAHHFGSPALGTLCRSGTTTSVTYRGLFGDAWLSCSVTAPVAAKLSDQVLTDRAGAWCVQVATTAAS